jgi:two-component system CheB/CheR fusion protein
MLLREIDSSQEYLTLIQHEPAEVDVLYNDFLIGVTSFFRDPAVFEMLATKILPSLIQGHVPDTPYRIWIPGCSTGQEVYSIAMCLLEALGDDVEKNQINIFATDISESALASARAGWYSAESVEDSVSPERQRRFFVKDANGYRVIPALRDLCVFAQQNVTSDPPFSGLDLISCRNVLIYLQPILHRKLFATFHFALKPSGILLIGGAESVGSDSSRFAAIDNSQFYTRRAVAATPLQFDIAELKKTHPPSSVVLIPPPIPARVLDVQRAADQILIARYTPAGVVVNDQLEIIQFRGQTTAYLEPASGVATLDLLKMVKRELLPHLRKAFKIVRNEHEPYHASKTPVKRDGKQQFVDLDVIPFKLVPPDAQYFLVLFTETAHEPPGTTQHKAGAADAAVIPEDTRAIGSLRQELEAQERHLQTVIDDHELALETLRLANIVAQTRSEELQSTAEVFATTKEELQSTNEELTTVNDEVRARNVELGILNDDLTNLVASIEIPVIMLDQDRRIRRFTPGTEPSTSSRATLDVRFGISRIISRSTISTRSSRTCFSPVLSLSGKFTEGADDGIP